MLESLRGENTHFRAKFRQTSYKVIVFARGEILSLFGAPKESLRVIIIYYSFKYSFRIKISLLESLRSEKKKKPFKSSI